MNEAVDRALSENHALIAAILEHNAAGRHIHAVTLLQRLQVNLEFITAVADHGLPIQPSRLVPTTQPMFNQNYSSTCILPNQTSTRVLFPTSTSRFYPISAQLPFSIPHHFNAPPPQSLSVPTQPVVSDVSILPTPLSSSMQQSTVVALPPMPSLKLAAAPVAGPRLQPRPGQSSLSEQTQLGMTQSTKHWSSEEHTRFEQAMRIHSTTGKNGRPNFNAIATHVGTRSAQQVRSHFQKFNRPSVSTAIVTSTNSQSPHSTTSPLPPVATSPIDRPDSITVSANVHNPTTPDPPSSSQLPE